MGRRLQFRHFSEVSLLVAFTDFTRFAAQPERLDDVEVARVMDAYYELAGRTLAAAGGRVVKFIGDATLAVFPAEVVDRGWESRLTVKATLRAGRRRPFRR